MKYEKYKIHSIQKFSDYQQQLLRIYFPTCHITTPHKKSPQDSKK